VDEGCDKLREDGGCRHADRAKLLSNNSERLKARRCRLDCNLPHTSTQMLTSLCRLAPAASVSGWRITHQMAKMRMQADASSSVQRPPDSGCSVLQVHDIEDLAAEGRRLSACPYFASREFAQGAEIVFCPYSYLVRPIETVAAWHQNHGFALLYASAYVMEHCLQSFEVQQVSLHVALPCPWQPPHRAISPPQV
jgi:DEAD_2